ncbi:MAG: bifunctional oligoribonuclease/PAP phosphatase NrnA [Bacillota bacterium]|nr:bifunctional oligoribonuclease/PAP phosphatase NrnA [Bacillota bacterium]
MEGDILRREPGGAGQKDWQEERAVLQVLQSRSRFLVLSHMHPDGDCIGSMVAMSWLLRRLGKVVYLVNQDGVPPAYRFLPGSREILRARDFCAQGRGERAEVAVILDSGNLKRLGEALACLSPEMTVVNIDHHEQNQVEGARTVVNYVHPEASATGELVYNLIRAAGLEIDREAALALYTAIFSDTGGFRFQNTNPYILALGAELARAGADPPLVAEHVFDTKSLAVLKLLGRALSSLEVTAGGRVAWIAMPEEVLTSSGVSWEETEGFVNYARMVEGAQVALLFREETGGKVRVSWRSRGSVDVGAMARELGGGGHVNAAGCEVPGPLNEGIQRVLRLVEERLAER